ncbi:hypothetical protein Hanom_Chr09g00865391 [Helianthus anomalus]
MTHLTPLHTVVVTNVSSHKNRDDSEEIKRRCEIHDIRKQFRHSNTSGYQFEDCNSCSDHKENDRKCYR